ncbi:fibronectin type III domain-containing protein, partial [Candidatus Marinimicrobia bacterium]|nr:fibronectin type III domain-containing protein [Candidatus Neomarinimicrobiota bacterium]
MLRFNKNLLLLLFVFNFHLFSDEITFSNANIEAGGVASIQVDISNQDAIGGFQMQILDFPNQGFFTQVSPTERTAAFNVSFNEQADGSVIIVAFDLTGVGMQPGDGSALELSYQSTGVYTSNIEISVNEDYTVLSDMFGGAFEYNVINGNIEILGEEPPPVLPVENLSAVGSFGEINLSWEDINDNSVEIIGYRIYRGGSIINTSTSTNYIDQGLAQSTEYCYSVSAYGITGESNLSNEVCAITLEIYLEEPQNLTAAEDGLEVTLDWDTPSSAIGIGDECVTAYEQVGFIDCSGICFEASLADSWIGDGFCDGINAQYGVNFSCSYWSCDGCDCAGETNGDQSNECIEDCGSFSLNNTGSQAANSKQIAEGTYLVDSRDLIGYEIYRNNELIDYVEETDYVDTSEGLWYLEDFCYNIVADYNEGSSGFSNTACVSPQLNSPSSLSAQGTGSFITLEWNAAPQNDQTAYNIYRNDELFAEYVTGEFYEDYNTEIGLEYCYYVKAFYEGIGESPASNTSCSNWDVYPPSQIEAVAGDQFVNLTWQEPVGGEEFSLQYDDGILANAFYFAGSYESGLAHGMKFDVGVDFDVLAASIKVLSDGDAYWPWPDGTHGPIRVMVFDDNNGVPGNLLHDEEAIAENGWATVYPGLTGLSGSFYVIASHDENWTDYEGFGVDGSVDYPDNMYTYYYGLWETGDYLGYGGDYMVATQIMAYGNIETLSSSVQQPAIFNSINSEVSISVNDGTRTADLSNESHPIYETRDLQTFDLYRDGELIANLDESTYSYIDQPLNNMTEYCYALGSTYDEGTSEISDPVCVTPYPGPPASNLIVEDLGGTMSLSWNAAIIDPLFGDNLINYQIYKDGVNIGETVLTNYIDSTEIIAGIDYCYQVKANYPSGETFGSNTDCGLFYLDPPVGLSSTGNSDDQHILIEWNEPGSFINYDVACDGGSWQSEVSWELISNGEVLLTGGAPFSQIDVPLFLGSYTLNMLDSYGDGWNGNVWSLIDGNSNVAASCTLDTGSEGACEFNLNGLANAEIIIPIQNEDLNKNYDEGVNNQVESIDNTQAFIYNNLNQNRDMLAFRIYRDGELLIETDLNTFSYIDNTTEHDVEYCYTLRTLYDEGESVDSNISCSQWILMPATDFDVVGTNGQIELTWTPAQSVDVLSYNIYRDGNLLLDTETLDNQYNDTSAIHNTEYCYQISALYELGESAVSDEECGMWEILSPDEVFADGQDGVVHVTWTDPPAGGEPGIGDECISFDYYYNETLGYVDCLGQCIPQTTVDSWVGDGICDDGSFGVFLDCDEYDWDGGDCPEYGVASNEEFNYRNDNQLENLLPFISSLDNLNQNLRELVAFNIYRDGLFLSTVDSGVYDYYDYEVENLSQYCYTITSVYEVGESEILDDPVCATPIPGLAPESLYAYSDTDQINLEWNGGGNTVIDYNIYRDGVLYDTTADVFYEDLNTEHDIEYCYVVSANYLSGESQSTNESCAMWVLAAPLSVSASGGNGFIQLDWAEPGVSTCADEVIPSLPFNVVGSNVGMGNDWLVQGSEGSDYSYLLNVTSPVVIDVTLCSANTTYDTKLEIFTADQDCNETTTGYYIDDFTCEFSSLQSTLQAVSLEPGQYYIVVDGYGGGEGSYEINVTQSFLESVNPSSIEYNLTYESIKSGEELNFESWILANGNDYNNISRSLLGFDIYRDNELIDSVESDVFTYIDLGLENGTEYCYYVVASYEEGDSQPTPIICASPDAGPMCPPENLILNIE